MFCIFHAFDRHTTFQRGSRFYEEMTAVASTEVGQGVSARRPSRSVEMPLQQCPAEWAQWLGSDTP